MVESPVAVHPTRTMKAIVQDRSGSEQVLRLRDVDTPIPADDRVLLRVRAASVNALERSSSRPESYAR